MKLINLYNFNVFFFFFTLLLVLQLVLVRLSVYECVLGGGLGVAEGELCALSVALCSSSDDTSCSSSHSSFSTDMVELTEIVSEWTDHLTEFSISAEKNKRDIEKFEFPNTIFHDVQQDNQIEIN